MSEYRGGGAMEHKLRGDKYSKREVHFEHPAKNGDCDDCTHFRLPRSCEIVSGRIEPEDWCSKFSRKER